MDEGWYEDPLEQFDGRYFTGTAWTERVAANGLIRIDADFFNGNVAEQLQAMSPGDLVDPPDEAPITQQVPAVPFRLVETDRAGELPTEEVPAVTPANSDTDLRVAGNDADGPNDSDVADSVGNDEVATPAGGESLPPDLDQETEEGDPAETDPGVVSVDTTLPKNATDEDAASDVDHDDDHVPEFATSDRPAVEPLRSPAPRRASLLAESEGRTVAVLNDDDMGLLQPSTERSWKPWLLAGIGGAVLVAALLFLASRNGGSDVAVSEDSAVELNADQEQRVQDLERGGSLQSEDIEEFEELEVDAPIGVVDPQGLFDEADKIAVGEWDVLNGASLLTELEGWHMRFAAGRGVQLGADAGCWFGELGGGVVQGVHCGPVGQSTNGESLWDFVPVAFEDATGGKVAQPVVDAPRIDDVLSGPLKLVGLGEPPQ